MEKTEFTALVLSMVVSGALLMATGWLCRFPQKLWRVALGSIVTGCYTLLCLGSDSQFWGTVHWRLLCLLLVGWIAFGGSIRRILVFMVLSLATEGLAVGTGQEKSGLAVPFVLALLGLCWIAVRSDSPGACYVPVELQLGEKIMKLTALRDTGNMLRDPISGLPVLILDARSARELTGLSTEQLQMPVEVMRKPPIPGLRLIPYKTIGQSEGMILGVRIPSVKVGSWQGSLTVAFAPEEFSSTGEFQALTGGTV